MEPIKCHTREAVRGFAVNPAPIKLGKTAQRKIVTESRAHVPMLRAACEQIRVRQAAAVHFSQLISSGERKRSRRLINNIHLLSNSAESAMHDSVI